MITKGQHPNLLADEPAATIYSEKPLDLALQASFLMDWDKYHPIVKLLESFGATDCSGRVESDDDSKARQIRARGMAGTKSRSIQLKYTFDGAHNKRLQRTGISVPLIDN